MGEANNIVAEPTNSTKKEPEPQSQQQVTSKKAAKKEAAKAEKLRCRQEAAAAAVADVSIEGPDPLAENYGDVPINDVRSESSSGRVWTNVSSLTEELKDNFVLVRGRAYAIRARGNKMVFLTVREGCCTVQCVLIVAPDLVSAEMVKFATRIPKDSLIEIEGIVTVPPNVIKDASQQVEIQVRKIYCVNRAANVLPFDVDDASRSEAEIQKALKAGKQAVRVNQDTRLNNRFLDLQTQTNQAIFTLVDKVSFLFKLFLHNEGFREIYTPKITAGTSEGGAAVFNFEYNRQQRACLAQSPQLYKQMAICGHFGLVFTVGPVFRAEDSDTHRHLCEFTGLDVEMEIENHYSEVMELVDRLFVDIFDKLNLACQEELEDINKQYPFEPLKYKYYENGNEPAKMLRLTFEQGIQMQKDAGFEVDPLGDLNTEAERKLGKLVKEKYGTEFYILYRYPLAVRPFYTMPCGDHKDYSNSFDVFIRGEEVISGSQRVHVAELLESRARECGIDVKPLSKYIDSFRYGAPPHGGFGAGLERVVMLFLNLDNIRKASLFPRYPRRLEP
ncbi:aspartate--tRNA ligase 1, cytoplasmic-like [Rutidosis leptorrhynchoides]|uniref:aspartate--tRNA ligase 1, cytoplasmic-like n=1 Tax=Rutidosis leptorrhynchoides TaxID=125765 RepID=UPI003A9980D9